MVEKRSPSYKAWEDPLPPGATRTRSQTGEQRRGGSEQARADLGIVTSRANTGAHAVQWSLP